MKYIFWIINLHSLILIMTAGCAVTPTRSTSAAMDARLEQQASGYKKAIQLIQESSFKNPGTCENLVAASRRRWDWKEAVYTADTCIKAKNLDRVEEMGNELSMREPAGPWGPYFLASVARDKGSYERALWMSELALKRAPEIGVIHYLKGQILWNKKEFGAAVYSFEKSTELDSNLVSAHLFLGRIYFRDQSYSKASKHFYAVLKVDPRHPVALAGLAESQLQEKNTQGALQAYEQLAESYPSDGQYLERIAEIYEKVLNDIPQALSTYRLLRDQVQTAKIKTNVDDQLNSKIKELELATQKTRALASTDEKESKIR